MDHLNETNRIKLGKPSGKGVNGFLTEFETKSDPHPFGRHQRIFENCTVELSKSVWIENGVHISEITKLSPDPGAGRACMQTICEMADRHKVTLDLIAEPYPTHFGTVDKQSLIKFYQSFGFEFHDYDGKDAQVYENDEMIRYPK